MGNCSTDGWISQPQYKLTDVIKVTKELEAGHTLLLEQQLDHMRDPILRQSFLLEVRAQNYRDHDQNHSLPVLHIDIHDDTFSVSKTDCNGIFCNTTKLFEEKFDPISGKAVHIQRTPEENFSK